MIGVDLWTPRQKRLFWAKVDIREWEPGECWHWMGARSSQGYGQVARTHNGRERCYSAHRVAVELGGREIPDGSVCRHKCDVRHCVNPSHIELGTHADNARDCIERGRHVPRGPSLGAAAVEEIRWRFAAGEHSSDLARAYGVSLPTIERAVAGRTYKNVGGPRVLGTNRHTPRRPRSTWNKHENPRRLS